MGPGNKMAAKNRASLKAWAAPVAQSSKKKVAADKCPKCGGAGTVDRGARTCGQCDGTGKREE